MARPVTSHVRSEHRAHGPPGRGRSLTLALVLVPIQSWSWRKVGQSPLVQGDQLEDQDNCLCTEVAWAPGQGLDLCVGWACWTQLPSGDQASWMLQPRGARGWPAVAGVRVLQAHPLGGFDQACPGLSCRTPRAALSQAVASGLFRGTVLSAGMGVAQLCLPLGWWGIWRAVALVSLRKFLYSVIDSNRKAQDARTRGLRQPWEPGLLLLLSLFSFHWSPPLGVP